VKRKRVGFIRNEVGSHDLYRDSSGHSAKVNAVLPLRQGQNTLAKKAILLQQEYFHLFVFNGLCQLQRQFIVSFDTYKLFA